MYLSVYLQRFCVLEGVGDRTKTATYWPPQPLQTSPCVVLVPPGSSTGGLGASLSGTCSHPSIFSPTGLQTQSGVPRDPSAGWRLSLPHLVSNSSDLQLTRGSQRLLLPGGGFLYHILSLTHLISNSPTSCLTELYTIFVTHSIFGMACLIVIKRK